MVKQKDSTEDENCDSLRDGDREMTVAVGLFAGAWRMRRRLVAESNEAGLEWDARTPLGFLNAAALASWAMARVSAFR